MRQVFGGFLITVVLFSALPVQAATLYMNPTTADIHPGDSVAVAVRLDTDSEECVNAASGVIEYGSALQPVDISLGKSIFPIWVEEPTIDTTANQITFAGGIPNGYCGRIEGDPRLTNTLFEIIFQAPGFRIGSKSDSPTSTVAFSDSIEVFLNDGAGTRADLRVFGSEIFVHNKPGTAIDNNWNQQVLADKQAPQQFSVAIEQNDKVFGGRYYIIFNTTDKQTGLDHYEVIEESLTADNFFNWGAADAPWRKARSPYVLQDQTLNSTIRVKAIDKAGNEYIATIVPDEASRSMAESTKLFYGFVAAGILITLVLVGAVVVYRVRSRQSEQMLEE